MAVQCRGRGTGRAPVSQPPVGLPPAKAGFRVSSLLRNVEGDDSHPKWTATHGQGSARHRSPASETNGELSGHGGGGGAPGSPRPPPTLRLPPRLLLQAQHSSGRLGGDCLPLGASAPRHRRLLARHSSPGPVGCFHSPGTRRIKGAGSAGRAAVSSASRGIAQSQGVHLRGHMDEQ